MLNTLLYSGVARLTVCLGYSQLRLANGGEDRLHLNDMIISDAASCNQGQGAQREIRREVLYAWIDRRSEEALALFVFLSPSVVEQEEKHKARSRWEWETNRRKMTMEELFGYTWTSMTGAWSLATRDLCHNNEWKFEGQRQETELDIWNLECLLEVELRVASCERGERAQMYFPVSVCVTGKKGEAQQGAVAGPLRPWGEFFVNRIWNSLWVSLVSCRNDGAQVRRGGVMSLTEDILLRIGERQLVSLSVGKCLQ